MSFYSVNASIRSCLVHHKSLFFCRFSSINLNYIKHLYKEGYLVSYNISDNKIKCFLNIYHDKQVLHQLVNYDKSHRYVRSYKKLYTDMQFTKSHTNFIICTNTGLLNARQCFFRKKGGRVVSKVN